MVVTLGILEEQYIYTRMQISITTDISYVRTPRGVRSEQRLPVVRRTKNTPRVWKDFAHWADIDCLID